MTNEDEKMTNEEALRILHCPSAYLTDEDSEFAHTIPMFSKAYGQAMAVAFEALKQADVLDKIKAEIEQLASRYTISRERGGMGQVEWSDRLIKESEVMQVLDKYKAEREERE